MLTCHFGPHWPIHKNNNCLNKKVQSTLFLSTMEHILTESKVSRGKLSKCRLMTTFPSLCTSLMFVSPRISIPLSVSFVSLAFSGTSLNIHNSEPGARNASRTYTTAPTFISKMCVNLHRSCQNAQVNLPLSYRGCHVANHRTK